MRFYRNPFEETAIFGEASSKKRNLNYGLLIVIIFLLINERLLVYFLLKLCLKFCDA